MRPRAGQGSLRDAGGLALPLTPQVPGGGVRRGGLRLPRRGGAAGRRGGVAWRPQTRRRRGGTGRDGQPGTSASFLDVHVGKKKPFVINGDFLTFY